jgi:ribosomal protein S12 methylthiotransferase accessory factor
MPRTRGSYDELVRRYGVLDPLEVCLRAGTAYDHGRVLDWVEARRFPEGEAVLVPVDLAATRFADLSAEEQRSERLITPITNGLGAGPTLEHALSHALLELIQRDGNSITYRALDRGIAVDTSETSDPDPRDLLSYLDREGVEVIAKLAATDLGMTNLYMVGYDRNPQATPHPLALSACGEAAHPNRDLALRKSLLEYVAARARKLFNHAPLTMIESVAPPGYLDNFRESPLGSEEDRSLSEMLDWLPSLPRGCTTCLSNPSTRSALASRSRTFRTQGSTRQIVRSYSTWSSTACAMPASTYSTWTIRHPTVRSARSRPSCLGSRSRQWATGASGRETFAGFLTETAIWSSPGMPAGGPLRAGYS